MVTVNIHEAKTQLSKLVDQAVKGEAFVIAKAGRPLVKVAALAAPAAPPRLGVLAGEVAGPGAFGAGPPPSRGPFPQKRGSPSATRGRSCCPAPGASGRSRSSERSAATI